MWKPSAAGEVLVRGFGFRWTIANIPELNMPEVLQYAIVAPHRDKSASYIINKAFKRVENGDEDNLAFFGEALLAGMNSASNDAETSAWERAELSTKVLPEF